MNEGRAVHSETKSVLSHLVSDWEFSRARERGPGSNVSAVTHNTIFRIDREGGHSSTIHAVGTAQLSFDIEEECALRG